MEQTIAIPAHTVRAIEWLSDVAQLVAKKGIAYGDSLRSPFSGQLSNVDGPIGILVRIEDKLGRLKSQLEAQRRGEDADGEDTVSDLVGYLALLATWNEPPDEAADDNVTDLSAYVVPGDGPKNGTH